MIKVVGVRFKKAGKIYYFDPEKKWINNGDFVIVETIRGIEYGQVVVGPKMVKEENIVQPLKKVLRLATEEDIKTNSYLKVKKIDLKKIEENIGDCNN